MPPVEAIGPARAAAKRSGREGGEGHTAGNAQRTLRSPGHFHFRTAPGTARPRERQPTASATHFFMKLFFSGVGQVPIDRAGGDASEAALRTGTRVLGMDKVLGIAAEPRLPPYATLPFRKGATPSLAWPVRDGQRTPGKVAIFSTC